MQRKFNVLKRQFTKHNIYESPTTSKGTDLKKKKKVFQDGNTGYLNKSVYIDIWQLK